MSKAAEEGYCFLNVPLPGEHMCTAQRRAEENCLSAKLGVAQLSLSKQRGFFVGETANSWEAIIPVSVKRFPRWRIHHSSCVCLDNQWGAMSSSAVPSHGLCRRLFRKVMNCAPAVRFGEPGQLGWRHLRCGRRPRRDSAPPQVCSAGASHTDIHPSRSPCALWASGGLGA